MGSKGPMYPRPDRPFKYQPHKKAAHQADGDTGDHHSRPKPDNP